MKKNAPYEINWTTNTITVSKRFMEASTIMGQGTYATMMELRKLNMPISVREIRRKKTGSMWSTERMEWYLDHVENSDQYKEQYMSIKGNSRAMVWGWFKKTFPHCQKIPVLNKDNQYMIFPPEYEGKKEKNWTKLSSSTEKNGMTDDARSSASAEISPMKKTA